MTYKAYVRVCVCGCYPIFWNVAKVVRLRVWISPEKHRHTTHAKAGFLRQIFNIWNVAKSGKEYEKPLFVSLLYKVNI